MLGCFPTAFRQGDREVGEVSRTVSVYRDEQLMSSPHGISQDF